jgi:hypothetical protein
VVASGFGLGCGASDEDQIRAAVTTWEAGALAKDVDHLMSIASESFSHEGAEYEAGSKAELREYIAASIEAGNFDDVQVNLDDMKVEVKGGKATAYPIQWTTPESRVALELFFTKEEAGWRWTDMAIGTRNQRIRMPGNAAEAMAQFDTNGDGRLSTDEMAGPLRARSKLMDANGDGDLDQEELAAAFQRMNARRPQRGGRRQGQ